MSTMNGTTVDETTKNETTTTSPTPEAGKSSDQIIPDDHALITEGSAKMHLPRGDAKKEGQNSVFYNPVQIQNRDLSILMISLYKERLSQKHEAKHQKKLKHLVDKTPPVTQFRVLEALAASGLRSVRYHNEIPSFPNLSQQITINDLEAAAVDLARENLKFNNISDTDETHIKVTQSDAIQHMYTNPSYYDVIDLDPYGSAATFLNAAIHSIKDGGLLCITCTDMAVLSGAHPETCFGRYGSMPMPKGRYLQELALRILLNTLHTTATRYGKKIVPILSVGMAFYIRVFVEVYHSKAAVIDSGMKVGMVYQSTQCDSFYTQTLMTKKGNVFQPSRIGLPGRETCESTGAPFKVAGPVWLDPLHDYDVVKEAMTRMEVDTSYLPLLSTRTPIHGLLTSVGEELKDAPLYYHLPSMCRTLHTQAPKLLDIYNAIRNAGYDVSAQHKEPSAIKTNAPPKVMWDILRYWVKKHPISKKWITGDNADSATAKILAIEPTTEINFTGKSIAKRNEKKAQRYPQNPEKNWGPKPRATGKRKLEEAGEETKDNGVEEKEVDVETAQPPEKK